MKHIHADLMAAYAADAQTTDRPWELWESHNTEVKIEWYTLKSDPSWNPSFEYRRKTIGHPHAELMAQYAEDAKTTDKPWGLWEAKAKDDEIWYPLQVPTRWCEDQDYRRKPKQHAIMLNENEAKKILVVCKSRWVKLRGEAANSALAWEIVESITEVLENMGVDVEENWIGEECKLTFTKKGEQQ